MTMSQRCADSKSWAEWSPGLKAAIVVAIQHRLRKQHQQQVGLLPMHLRQEPDSEQLEDQHQNLQLRPLKATTLEAWRSHYLNDHMPARRDCQHCVRAQARGRYEKELLDRWNVGSGSEFPMFKLSEADFEAVESVDSVDAGVLREAQALAGGLLWLSTKSRPDLSYGVSTMSRLMTRNPQKALDVGQALLRYLKSNPGDLHYTRDIPKDGWGERGQLKIQRSNRSIEIFSDISYAAGTSYRSIQGVAVFVGGSPIAWQSWKSHSMAKFTTSLCYTQYCRVGTGGLLRELADRTGD